MNNFDTSKHYLGTLCKRGHDYKGTGKSLRYKCIQKGKKTGPCIECRKEANKREDIVKRRKIRSSIYRAINKDKINTQNRKRRENLRTKKCKCGCEGLVVNEYLPGHNPSLRGKNHPNYGKKQSIETIKKRSRALRGRKLSQKNKDRIGDANRMSTPELKNRLLQNGFKLIKRYKNGRIKYKCICGNIVTSTLHNGLISKGCKKCYPGRITGEKHYSWDSSLPEIKGKPRYQIWSLYKNLFNNNERNKIKNERNKNKRSKNRKLLKIFLETKTQFVNLNKTHKEVKNENCKRFC